MCVCTTSSILLYHFLSCCLEIGSFSLNLLPLFRPGMLASELPGFAFLCPLPMLGLQAFMAMSSYFYVTPGDPHSAPHARRVSTLTQWTIFPASAQPFWILLLDECYEFLVLDSLPNVRTFRFQLLLCVEPLDFDLYLWNQVQAIRIPQAGFHAEAHN